MVNVCFITPEYYPITGGTGSYVYYLSSMLVKHGNSVCIVTKNSGHGKEKACEKTRILSIKASRVPVIDPLLFFRASYEKLNAIKAKFPVDVAHANLPLIPSFAVPDDFGAALVSTVHSTWDGEANAIKNEPFSKLNFNEKIVRSFTWFLKQFEYRLLKRSDMIIAVSEYTKKEILKNYDMPAWKIKVIFNGVDLDKFKPARDKAKFKRELGFNDRDLLILYVGRLYSRKGLPTLISAIPHIVKKVRNARFIISGKGFSDEEKRLRGYAEKFKVRENVIFLGYFPDEKLPSLYKAADIFVFPSIYENMPFAMLEALASGLPVVTTRVGGIPEVIDNGKNGFLVEPYDSLALADKVLCLIENPSLALEIGLSGRKTVERRFNWNNIVKQVLEIYDEALTK
ncbi:MAG: glycosyltransferase family 4 protein [Candidatus Bathyarchaeia archaeon]